MKKKILGILIIVMLLCVPITIFATYTGIDTNISIGNTPAVNSSIKITERMVGMLQVVGTVVSVVALIIIGIRYMLSSIEEKAQIKGVIGYYIVGCILVFATTNILAIVYDVITSLKY